MTLVNYKGLIEDFECHNCHWVLEDEVIEMDDDGQGEAHEDSQRKEL